MSGGADSTQALLVATTALDQLGWPRQNILGFSLPGFATTAQTRDNARATMAALGVTAGEIDIRPAALQMLRDINHPYSRGEPSGLSELALVYTTDGVDDHVPHYAVNASVPKTRVRHLLRWSMASGGFEPTPKQRLEIFLARFFANQFKRSALPSGPKVGSGGALSPRGGWRAPSDSSSEPWLRELAAARR